MNLSEPVTRIQTGNLSLIICCIFYLIWWAGTFNPARSYSTPVKYILFLITLVAGLAGIALLITAMKNMPVTAGSLSNFVIAGIGVAAYVILLLLTNFFLHRQVTTELLLIVGWTVLELCAMNSLFRAETFGNGILLAAVIVILAAAVIGMICYLMYYNLEEMRAFYVGMVPLILFAAEMVFQILLVLKSASISS